MTAGGVPDFRQRPEQYFTSAQFLAQDFRQLMSRPHPKQGLLAREALLPLKESFLIVTKTNPVEAASPATL